MPYLLNLVYLLLIAVLSPYLAFSAIRKGKYRAGLAAKWLGLVPRRTGSNRCIWLHAVSVGEVNLLAPLLKALEHEYPAADFVISTTSATGYALASKKYAPRTVFYCPLDFSWAVHNAMRRVRPDLLILAELELWPNLVWAAKRAGAQVAVINGRLSERSFRGYRRIRPLVRQVLKHVDVIAAQNAADAERFISLGAEPERVHVTGSLKFDGAESCRQNARTQGLASLAGITPADIVFLAGSTQAPEEQYALDAFLALRDGHPQLRLLLAPRHPERFDEVAALLDRSGVAWQRRSQLECASRHPAPRVLLIDVVGELGAWWGTAHIGFVGGSLENQRGGQNMIEPAAYGAAVSFGPHTWNFKDIVALMLEREAAVVVHNSQQMTAFVARCLLEPAFTCQLGGQASRLVLDQQGATRRTLELLEPLLRAAPAVVRRTAA